MPYKRKHAEIVGHHFPVGVFDHDVFWLECVDGGLCQEGQEDALDCDENQRPQQPTP